MNEVECQTFVFSFEGVHELFSDDQCQFDISSYDKADSYFHSGHDVEFNADLYVHYEKKHHHAHNYTN